ncbi:MAG: nitrogen regulation protein NR(II), partial [Desulfomonilaceae bacterium]
DGATSQKQHCGLTVSGEEANYVSYTTPIFDQNGKVIYAMVIAMDIGDKVKLQKELQVSKDFQTNLIENSIHGIIATDETWRIAIYNNAAQNLLQYKIDEAIGDTDLQKYFPQPFIEMILASQGDWAAPETRLVTREVTLKSADGELIPVSFSGFMLFDNDKPSGAVGFIQDLRTFKRLEREKQASDRLAVVGQTVAGLAHGIKNIIQGLEGGLFVVESAMEDNDKKLLDRGWRMVQNNIVRISNLVKDLLNYSKERNPEYQPVDPNQLAEEVCNLFEIKAREKGITIVRDFDSRLGTVVQVFLDQRGIHTCLSNLVSNAIDACESDSSKEKHSIIVKTSEDAEDGLILEVSDDGMGMTDETKRKLFSSFYSTKGSRGTGLGLLVTSKIVSEHGGQMFFESELGKGSRFIIKLPSKSSSQISGEKRAFISKGSGFVN